MGTSKSYGGPGGKTPLLPTWLDGGESPNPVEPPVNPTDPGQQPTPPIGDPQVVPPMRFQTPRANYSRFVSSGGSNSGALKRAVSGYVSKSSGGAATATRRMGSSRVAAGRLLSFLSDAKAGGLSQALQKLNLGQLVGKPIEELFVGLADYICSSNGSVDAGIARDAYIDAIPDLIATGIESLDTLTEGQIQTVFEIFVSNSIFDRLLNDIGAGTVQLPDTSKDVILIQEQVKDYIRGAVHDAADSRASDFNQINQQEAGMLTTEIYEQAFTILTALGGAR